ncbi:hypothetical protein OAC86_00045 [bacterium]|nr:hypothetical protein [bacterium]MDB9899914.1 hypothetical protein [bacterium]
MSEHAIYEAEQEYNKFLVLVNAKEYITKDEYNFIIAYDPTEETNFSYIGDYSKYGDYLNLNVYSEHEHHEAILQMEIGA